MNKNEEKRFPIPYIWSVSGVLGVYASSFEEACAKLENMDRPSVYDPDKIGCSMSVNHNAQMGIA